MSRITLVEALRAYDVERGLDPEEAEVEALRLRSLAHERGKGSADIHLHDFYFVALEEDGEFYVEAERFEAALEVIRSHRTANKDG